MPAAKRPYRSVLYIPASKERAIEKVQVLETDAVIFDLEDAVSPDAKITARNILVSQLKSRDFGARAKIVRINAFNTEWGIQDAKALASLDIDGVLLPKVETPEALDALHELCPSKPLWAMMETPLGILNAAQIAAHPGLAGFVAGTNDLAKDIGCAFSSDRLPLLMALQHILLAARAHGIIAIDGVYNAFKDDEGLRTECEQGRDLGFDGKTLIHPAQLAITNEVFAPSEDDLQIAREQIAAFDEVMAKGEGVAVVRGKIVENLHVDSARRLLENAGLISQMRGGIAR